MNNQNAQSFILFLCVWQYQLTHAAEWQLEKQNLALHASACVIMSKWREFDHDADVVS